ncbi:MAG: glutathione S-transferase family protein [Gammaproteobacteria bacterium]|nr:glutathione S-transferase family protein [Gammaproteobacteria bacterium]MCP4089598.1 glutathione S-transferase family protein [Gammaproteobacteria bacterium]MCP4278067.1 glutathione S-transferase family protein [Gammaproteobacteria bacterium]MCP4833043.1 glutathione S-transferase family protein [Gammaproteobacteria bacterium]MCP4929002.1 glutathione S-transferase family protein [Gammaproteobacteria bacterium]
MSQLHLYSFKTCPFARRTRMTLLEKGLDFELTEIDIQNKPDNFSTIAPYGKVPVLLHEGRHIYESAIINEYIDERFPEPPLMPADPLNRAEARIWMDYCTHNYSAAIRALLMAEDDAQTQSAHEAVRECMLFIEHEGLRKLSEGPFWLGKKISLIDIQFMPFFQRRLENNRAEIPAECIRLHGWLDTMISHPSWLATAYDQTKPD